MTEQKKRDKDRKGQKERDRDREKWKRQNQDSGGSVSSAEAVPATKPLITTLLSNSQTNWFISLSTFA